MNNNRQLQRITPSSLYALLQLQLEGYIEFERRDGRILRYIDRSVMTDNYCRVNVAIFNADNTCVARYDSLCLPQDYSRAQYGVLINLLHQLNQISSQDYINLLNEVNNLFPLLYV